jgi:hypothetical protein
VSSEDDEEREENCTALSAPAIAPVLAHDEPDKERKKKKKKKNETNKKKRGRKIMWQSHTALTCTKALLSITTVLAF